MMSHENPTDDELVKRTQAGEVVYARYAEVEMMRRLKESLAEQNRSTQQLNKRILWFTIAIFVLTIIQAISAAIAIFRAVF